MGGCHYGAQQYKQLMSCLVLKQFVWYCCISTSILYFCFQFNFVQNTLDCKLCEFEGGNGSVWQYFIQKYASLVFVDFAWSFVNKCGIATTHSNSNSNLALPAWDIFSETDTASGGCRLPVMSSENSVFFSGPGKSKTKLIWNF